MVTDPATNSQSWLTGNPPRVGVLMGGIGQERDISIQSGKCVVQALRKAGLNVTGADIKPDNMDVLDDGDIDVFFLALHGKFGEDGQLQQILEDKSLAYTGSGPPASRLAFDKMASKKCFAQAGVATPKAVEFDALAKADQSEKQLLELGDRFVVKPIRQGSTIGVTVADDPKSAVSAATQCAGKFGDCMIEEFIAGREITVGILEGRTLPIIEIRTKTGFYDYHAKYLDKQTEFLFDTIGDRELAAEINEAAVACFNCLCCRDLARADFILDDQGTAYALEVNTIPGLTTHSLVPKAAAKAGLSMSHLCLRIIEAALKRSSRRATLADPALDIKR